MFAEINHFCSYASPACSSNICWFFWLRRCLVVTDPFAPLWLICPVTHRRQYKDTEGLKFLRQTDWQTNSRQLSKPSLLIFYQLLEYRTQTKARRPLCQFSCGLVHCIVTMNRPGFRALLLLCCAVICVSGMRRDYFIRIEEVSWNYAPTGMNVIQNRTLEQDE